jgi:hypothetical protein
VKTYCRCAIVDISISGGVPTWKGAGTQTEKNLKAAFAGESQERNEERWILK